MIRFTVDELINFRDYLLSIKYQKMVQNVSVS